MGMGIRRKSRHEKLGIRAGIHKKNEEILGHRDIAKNDNYPPVGRSKGKESIEIVLEHAEIG